MRPCKSFSTAALPAATVASPNGEESFLISRITEGRQRRDENDPVILSWIAKIFDQNKNTFIFIEPFVRPSCQFDAISLGNIVSYHCCNYISNVCNIFVFSIFSKMYPGLNSWIQFADSIAVFCWKWYFSLWTSPRALQQLINNFDSIWSSISV